MFGLLVLTFAGCRITTELTRVRGWDENFPTKILDNLPKGKWVKHMWGRSDDRVFKKASHHLELVETRWSGQEHRVWRRINDLLLMVEIAIGKLTWLQVMLERTWVVLPGRRYARVTATSPTYRRLRMTGIS